MSIMKTIKYKNKKIASIITYLRTEKNSINFFTNQKDEFQLATMSREKNYKIKAHHHPKRLKKIYMTSEVLILLKGKIKITFYDDKKKILTPKIIKKGQMIIFFSGGHEFDFLERSSLIEIKQGPYLKNKDKKFIS